MKTDMLRDLFAARAMDALVTALAQEKEGESFGIGEIARISYDMADAMMCERSARALNKAAIKTPA